MTRVLSGIVMAAGALAAILFLPPIGLRVLVALLAGAAAFEYMALVGVDNSRGRVGFVLLAGLIAWQLSSGVQMAIIAPMALLVAGAFAVFFRRTTGQQAVLGAFSMVYIGMPLGMLAALQIARGWRATVLLIATVVVSDSLQFYTGRLFGKHPLAPAISPKKTIEGAVGGMVFGTIFAVLAGHRLFPSATVGRLVLLGVAVVILGICGDLFESRLKRAAGMKDSSALIPGHGGVLDRIDSHLFAAPAFYLFVQFYR